MNEYPSRAEGSSCGSAATSARRDLVIVGNVGGSHIGGSLTRGAGVHGMNAIQINCVDAYGARTWIRRLFWHACDRRPPKMNSFQQRTDDATRLLSKGVLITTGLAPITVRTLSGLKQRGFVCLHYSTDDPWNPTVHARWFIKTLPLYDKIFTPRLSTVPDFESLGCTSVVHLPFGYDPELFFPEAQSGSDGSSDGIDVLFVGGADRDRALIIEQLVNSGLRLSLYGGYWERYGALKSCHRGMASPEEIRRATSRAAINLCLVRRANRDGHVMRSFEIPAIGGFMLAEDTQDHRQIFGVEGQHVLYFSSSAEAIEKARWALSNPADCQRMARSAHERIVSGKNTYGDRLEQMLLAAGIG
jgi:spore maturation protein CgeB